MFVNAKSGYEVDDTCLVSDPTCKAICRCDAGYGLACSLSVEESLLRADLRNTMVKELESVISAEDVASSISRGLRFSWPSPRMYAIFLERPVGFRKLLL